MVKAEDRAAELRAQAGLAAAPTIQVYSRETVVDVIVTDKDGKPVHGLTRADFTVMEDGKPQGIRSFKETVRDRASVAAPLPKLPAGVYTNLRPTAASETVNIVLLDELNVPWAAQVQSRKQAVEYLNSMPSGTQVAVLLLVPSGVRIVQGFTSDPTVLIAAINDPNNPAKNGGGRGVRAAGVQEPSDSLEALREVAAFVEGTKGRKNLIWFTVGMQSVIFPVPLPDPPMPCMPDFTEDLHKAYDLLTAAQVAVYSCSDPRGLMEVRKSNGMDFLAMEAVAEATGGGAFYNTNDLAGSVGKAVEGGANYYTLSYVPPGQQYDGRHHSIHVKVERPGVQLVYRDEYYAEDSRRKLCTRRYR